jgi:hypothetical protein
MTVMRFTLRAYPYDYFHIKEIFIFHVLHGIAMLAMEFFSYNMSYSSMTLEARYRYLGAIKYSFASHCIINLRYRLYEPKKQNTTKPIFINRKSEIVSSFNIYLVFFFLIVDAKSYTTFSVISFVYTFLQT